MRLLIRCVLCVLSFGFVVLGVVPSQASKSALLVTACRAIGAKHPDSQFRNPDYMALQLLGPRERALLRDGAARFVNALDLDYVAAIKSVSADELITAMCLRTRHIDSILSQSLQEMVQQVVILGAGFDSRAYRFRGASHTVVFFEVDYPPTQAHKKVRIKEVLGALPGNVRYVPMDFTKHDLLTELRKGGYSEKGKTLFIAEGLTMYLPQAAVEALLHFVRDKSPAHSTIVFDYYLSSYPSINNANTLVARWGEPIMFGFPGTSASEFVRSAGLTVIHDYKQADLVRRYAFSWGAVRPAEASGICFASVPDQR